MYYTGAYGSIRRDFDNWYGRAEDSCLGTTFMNATTSIFTTCSVRFHLTVTPDLDRGTCSACGDAKNGTGKAGGNPINIATANKFQSEVDYRGANDLDFVRSYNSRETATLGLGIGWRHNYQRRLLPYYSPESAQTDAIRSRDFDTQASACVQGWLAVRGQIAGAATQSATWANNVCTVPNVAVTVSVSNAATSQAGWIVERGDGQPIQFASSGGSFVGPANITGKLESITGGFKYTDNDVVEIYNSSGVLQSITDRRGNQQTLAYTSGRLTSVTDSFGRSLQFQYDGSQRLWKLIDPAGKEHVFAYSGANLASVTRPDTKVRTYRYENASFPSALTGITDENNANFASWSYDSDGRGTYSTHSGGAGEVTITPNSPGNTTVTDSIGTSRTYVTEKVFGKWRLVDTTEPCSTCPGGVATEHRDYDANGYLSSITNKNGVVTKFVNDARGLENSRTEAYGTPLARTITTQWHATYRVPTQIDESGRRTTFTHDGSGNVLTKTVLDTNTNVSRTTTWTYNTLGQVLTVNGPRTDVTDVTTYTYDAQGNVATITDALSHVTQITNYDAHGNPLRIVDPNGVVTLLTYDDLQRLKTRTVGSASALTTFDYDGVGQLTKVTLPDGSFLIYTYDAAHRLTDITDSANNKIHYTLDKLGNRIKEETLNPSATLKRQSSRVMDELDRLKQLKDAGNNIVMEYGYDAQGNRTSQLEHIDASNTASTVFVPDSLDRIKQVNDAASGTTLYGYNALDQLISVTDPKGLLTSYTVNALGDMTKQISPDTGTTDFTYDSGGNRSTQTDARGITATFTYDKLNRLTSIDYPGTAEDVTYTYDGSTSNGIGRLTGIADQSGTTTLYYDERGNLTREDRLIDGTTYSTLYTFEAADRVSSITYPSGRVVNYTRNALGQVTKVTTTVSGVQTTVADNIAYLPFGGVKSYSLANGVLVTRDHDLDYRLHESKGQAASTVQDLVLDYDLRGNVKKLTDAVNAARTQDLGYDSLSRLTSTASGLSPESFTYDAVGNRLTRSAGSVTDTYSYPSSSHRLASQTSGPSYSYDAAGNVTGNGTLSLTYNNAGRLSNVTGGSAAVSNVFAASGQRIKKTAGGITTRFIYDQQGHLLSEMGDTGTLKIREYVWLGDEPLSLETTNRVSDFIVDNTGSGFSTSGSGWQLLTDTSDKYGSSYRRREAAANITSGSITLDDANAIPGSANTAAVNSPVYYSGVWSDVTGVPFATTICVLPQIETLCNLSYTLGLASKGAAVHRSVAPAPDSTSLTFNWKIPVPSPGLYRVYASWPNYAGAGSATYGIDHHFGTATRVVDQSTANGAKYLGIYRFDTEAHVTLTPNGNAIALADTVTVVPVEDLSNVYASWAAPTRADQYDTYIWWPTTTGASTAAQIAITSASGSSSLNVDQNTGGGGWTSLGRFSFDSSTAEGVKLFADNEAAVLADAVRFAPVTTEDHFTSYYLNDHLGTPQKLTDATGAVVWDAAYGAFGAATLITHAIENPLRFPGQYFDAETGLHQNWYREYDPNTGRYLQSDPIGLMGSLNTYLYVGGNTFSYADPFGLKVYLAEKSIDGDPSGIGSHTWVILQPDHPEELGLRLDANGRLALRAGPSGPGNDRWAHGAKLKAQFGGDSTTVWRQRYDIPTPNYMDCEAISDDSRHIRDIVNAYNSFIQNQQGKLPYSGLADTLDGVEQYNSNSFTAAILQAAGSEVPDPWGYQPGLDKPVPLK